MKKKGLGILVSGRVTVGSTSCDIHTYTQKEEEEEEEEENSDQRKQKSVPSRMFKSPKHP